MNQKDKNSTYIGNTPLIKIRYKYSGEEKEIYTKLEYFNVTGSIKDRVAWYIINNAINRGELKPGMPIIEATSGNTGISLASLGAKLGYPVYIFMPDWVSKERIKIMKDYGANIYLISKEEGGFVKCVKEAKKLSKKLKGFLANQFASKDNFLSHYETTAEEILKQIPKNKKVGAFISGVGTGGTLMGTGARLKEQFSDMSLIALEPDKMPIISGKKIVGQHKIEGIGDDFVPALLEKKKIDKILLINDDDAINMSRKLAKNLGLGVGISSGANFLASILANEEMKTSEDIVVTVFADDNKKYLSTDLSKRISKNKEFLSNQIELISYE